MTEQPEAPVAPPRLDSPSGLVDHGANTALGSVAIALSSLVAAGSSAIFAMILPALTDRTDEIDGFLVAYSAYAVFVIFGSSIRAALVPLFGPSSDERGFTKLARTAVKRIVPVAVVLCAALAISSPWIGGWFLGGASERAQEVASLSAVILAAAAVFQIWTASLAAVLTGARRFIAVSLLFGVGNVVTVGIAIVMGIAFGTVGAAIGVTLGALALLVAHLVYLRRIGFGAVPAFTWLRQRRTWTLAGLMAAGTALPAVLQINLTIALGAIEKVEGFVTGYTYAYLIVATLAGITSMAIGTVTIPNLVDALDRPEGASAESISTYLRETSQFSLFLFLAPAVGYALAGLPVLEAVFGGVLDDSTIDVMWDCSRVFLVLGVAMALLVSSGGYAIASRQYVTLARTTVLFVPLMFVAVQVAGDAPVVVATVHTTVSSVTLLAMAIAVLRSEAVHSLTAIAIGAMPGFALGAIFALPALALGSPHTLSESLVLLVTGTAAYFVVGYLAWPNVVRRMLTLLLGRRSLAIE